MYTAFNNRNIQQLAIVRRGWLKPEYDLVDNLYTYGRLIFKKVSIKNQAVAQTADDSWTIRQTNIWKKKLDILDSHGAVAGSITTKTFSWNCTLKMNNGFTALLTKPSFWKANYTWTDESGSPLLRIESKAFSNTDEVFIEQSNTALNILPLLALAGAYLIILRRQRQAAS